jgi:integrase/recombinase XerD
METVHYLFESTKGSWCSLGSIVKVIKLSAKKTGIMKHIIPYMLRHSFVTHLLGNGIEIHTSFIRA